MPQMMPLMWALFIILIPMFLMFLKTLVTFYQFNLNPSKSYHKFDLLKNMFIFKW